MKYNKLVRDKIPEFLDSKKISYKQRIASDKEYKFELTKKLIEEVNEFAEDGEIEELADVIEVIEALKKISDYSKVQMIRSEKFKEKGGFDKKIILEGEK